MEGLPPPSKAPLFPIVTADQRSVLGVATADSIIPTLDVSLRILARNVARRSLEAIDYCIIAACIFAVALESVSITGVIQGGIGCGHTIQVIQESGPEPVPKLLKLLIPLQFLWVLSLSFCKVSILLLYSRIGRGAMVFIAAWAIATIIAGCTICRLFAYNWDQSIPGGECGDQVLSFTITGVSSTSSLTCWLLCLPLPYLAKLQMQLYKKVILIGVFSIGLLTYVVSTVRIHTLSSMDFKDITVSIPPAKHFLRPRTQRSRNPILHSAPTAPTKPLQLNDDSLQNQLRPVAGKHFAAVSTAKKPTSSRLDRSDLESSEAVGITVQEHWHVGTERC
ncbi:integral membrane protein [Blastomyces dermatitidis ATCC 18188]|uniref:Integral membrane protein n=1 Tax=Ajellomyces dermatitidis (strain ATCC 18188 / CBS 674.68) TaxID=653446 RepID=F2T5X3_AJEDA|nr:integral membrane protein [Blastomyces dermatitidis ATCC 18188]